MRARLALILITLGLVLVGGLEGESAGKGSSGSRAATWGSLQILAAASQYAFAPQLAVAPNGQTLAAWFGGPPAPRQCAAMVCPPTPPWSGSEVVLDPGTVEGGFGPPVVVSAHGGSDSERGLQVAISGTGVSYAAWEEKSGQWMLTSAASGGAFGAPHALAAGRYRSFSLVRSPEGPVAAVWFGGAGKTTLLHYALLRPNGTLGRAITVGRWNGSAEGTPFALNDRGEFAALDIVGQVEEGTVPPAPLVHVCNAAGRCSRPHELHFGHTPAKADENQAIALSDDGTVTVLASFSKSPRNPAPNTPLGLWAAVRRPGKHWSTPQELSRAGEMPLAVADGKSSMMVLFDHFWTPKLRFLGNRLETATLPVTGTRLTRPTVVSGLEAPEPATLVANNSGAYLIAGIPRQPDQKHRCRQRQSRGTRIRESRRVTRIGPSGAGRHRRQRRCGRSLGRIQRRRPRSLRGDPSRRSLKRHSAVLVSPRPELLSWPSNNRRRGFWKRARQDSNLRPLAPEASALSTELRAREPDFTGRSAISRGFALRLWKRYGSKPCRTGRR